MSLVILHTLYTYTLFKKLKLKKYSKPIFFMRLFVNISQLNGWIYVCVVKITSNTTRQHTCAFTSPETIHFP